MFKNKTVMKIVMFVSSYFPLYIMLLILNFDKYSSLNQIVINKKENIGTFIFLILMLISIIISLYSLFDLKRTNYNEKHVIGKIERPDDTVISYMMTYIIPLLTTENLDNKMILINLFLFILIGYLYVRLNLVYLNPLWAISGYIMYKTSCNKVLITNIEFEKINNLSGKRINCRLLTSNIFLVQKIDNLKLI